MAVSSPRMSAVAESALLATAALTPSIMRYITDPVDSISDSSAIVSRVDGAPPTTAMTAAVTALDRLTPSALIAADSAESAPVSDDAALCSVVDRDATPDTRLDVLVDSAADSVESMADSDDVAVDSVVASDATSDARTEA